MNQIQQNYINLKAQYDQLEQSEQWEQLEAMEDNLLDAEFDLVNWSLDELAKHDKESSDFLRKNWTQNSNKMIDIALRLKVA